MKRILIFGNSGSGKSTLARVYSAEFGLAHLDLDSLAWEPTNPPTRKPLPESRQAIKEFLGANATWIIEGCYSDLLEMAADQATEVVFLNPGVEQCIANCRNRPWEPHKYASPEKQDEKLEMLVAWVKLYPERTDEFSLVSHKRLYARFQRKKVEHRSNVEIT